MDHALLLATLRRIVAEEPVWDMHTHLYAPSFGTPFAGRSGAGDPDGLLLWGIDELLTYHYLVAEVFRVVAPDELPYAAFWRMSKRQQADHVWKHLFVERSPISEACRGVLTTLQRLGLDVGEADLNGYRRWFAEQDPDKHIDRVMELAGVERITMTNDVFDDNERHRWLADPNVNRDSRFDAVLRFDPILRDWPAAAAKLSSWGYTAAIELDQTTIDQARRFLDAWLDRMRAVYAAVSLPPQFTYGQGEERASSGAATVRERSGQTPPLSDDRGFLSSLVLRKVVLPVLRDRGLPLAMMIGSTGRVNPDLRDAGHMGGRADVASVARLCADHPDNRFMVTMLSRENQHELAVAARKFSNLMVFGCWWFLNNPSLVDEITRMRCELLGTSFVPQHSDARVLEQLVYKWDHSRRTIADVLADKYADLAATGWRMSAAQLQRDVSLLMRDNYRRFIGAQGNTP